LWKELNVLPRSVQLTTLCEQAHYRDAGASFPQSTFQVTFFILDPADFSELPDKNLD
jgi:hypothetical protein